MSRMRHDAARLGSDKARASADAARSALGRRGDRIPCKRFPGSAGKIGMMVPMDWTLFASTYALIFVAELPDKTVFLTLLMATRHNPYGVFLGASAAFVVQSVLAVTFGSLLHLLPEWLVRRLAGAVFLFFSWSMWRQKGEQEAEELEKSDRPDEDRRLWLGVRTAFAAIFVAEWGDLTQLATATLAARRHAPFTIAASATLALWTVTAIGAALGHNLQRLINPRVLQKIGAVVFALAGVIFLAR